MKHFFILTVLLFGFSAWHLCWAADEEDDPFAEPVKKTQPAKEATPADKDPLALPSLDSLLEETPAEKTTRTEEEAAPAEIESEADAIRATPRRTVTPEKDADGLWKWSADLPAARQQSVVNQQPLLVKVGSAGCVWCAKLELEFQKPALQRELARWTLTYLDAEKSFEEANRLKVSGLPALRIINLHGELVAQQDGYLPEKELLAWLQKNFAKATILADAVLVSDEPLNKDIVQELVGLLQERNPLERETAIRRLAAEPELSKEPVLQALLKGNLAARLAAWEILQQWQAPIAALDPWQPQTFTAERETELRTWITTDIEAALKKPADLSPEDQQTAAAGIQELLAAEDEETARILRERLMRFDRALLPLVRDALAQATADQDQERLLALRYRLVADNALVLNWPGGLERLAARDVKQRHLASEELAARATAKDQDLLLELFSDPDPLVREISLRGLQQVGGVAALKTMIKLLYDPDPNVRAAVLKQLAEGESPGLALQVVKYVKQEQDADLLVHAIRYLKSSDTEDVRACLSDLTVHESWQVRAEAAEALGSSLGRDNLDHLATFNRLIELLDDADSFVVSRAMEAISHGKIPSRAVEKLAQAAEKHPDLAIATVQVLARSELTTQAVPQLIKFIKHPEAPVRAAAISALATLSPYDYSEELLKSLADDDPAVRTAGATAIFEISYNLHNSARREGFTAQGAPVIIPEARFLVEEEPEPGFLDKVFSLLGGGKAETAKLPAKKEAAEPEEIQEATPAEGEKESPQAERAEKVTQPAEKVTEPREKVEQPAGEIAGEAEPQSGDLAAEDTEQGWIQRYRLGKKRPSWLTKAIAPLTKLLTAESANERFAAALALIPLQDDPQLVAVLKEAAGKDREKLQESAKALTWLPWEQRSELFDFLVSSNPTSSEIYVIGNAMASIPDPRSAEAVWKLLADDDANLEIAATLRYVLEELYRGNNYEPTPVQQKEAQAALGKFIEQGTPVQQVLALDLLRTLLQDTNVAATAATKLLEHKKFPADYRLEVFRVLLLAQAEPLAKRTAMKILEEKNLAFQGVAVRYLAKGSAGIASLEGSPLSMHESRFNASRAYEADRKNILIEAPKGLKLEMVQPLLQNADADLAACAGYLAATLGEKSGLDPLLAHWRSNIQDTSTRTLVVRAITVLDDPLQVPVLEEIYDQLDTYDVPEFYWTIRSMTGPEVLALRKKIRDAVGMSRLR